MTREEMRNRIQATLNDSEDYCARCQHCDRQLDALVDVVTAKTPFGDGYREAMRDMRDILKAAVKDEGSSSSGGAP